MIQVDTPEHPVAHVGLVVITGTHSSGKTTLYEDLQARYQDNDRVAFVEEAATAFALTRDSPEVLTSGYTFPHQIEMEVLALSSIVGAVGRVARAMNDTHNAFGLVVSDRSPLDGHIYSRLRTPTDDSDTVSMKAIEDAVYGRSFNTTGAKLPFRSMVTRVMRDWCDLVILPNHQEVYLEDNGLREQDADFRDQVAQEMASYYSSVVGDEKILSLSGSRQERLDTAEEHLETLLNRPD